MFDGRLAILTPTKNTRAEDFDLLEQFWQSLGSVVVQMTPEEHDQALAMTSHLPHVAAAALALTLPEKYFRLIGHGHVGHDPRGRGRSGALAADLALNRDNVLTALEQYGAKLAALHAALRDNEPGRNHPLSHPREEEPRCFGKLTFTPPRASRTSPLRNVAAAAAELHLADRSGRSLPPADI